MGDERDVEAEIAFHIDSATAENLAKGMPPAEARAEAIRRFGDPEVVRRQCLAARGRALPRPVAWAAVGLLAAVSFLAGYGTRDGASRLPVISPPTTRPQREFLIGRLERDPARFVITPFAHPVDGVIVDSAGVRPAFRGWRWRDGSPEVSLDGREWLTLVSAGGVPAAELREDHRKACGLPEGTYRDEDPGLLIMENPRCGSGSVEVVLRRLTDGTEVRVAWLTQRSRGR